MLGGAVGVLRLFVLVDVPGRREDVDRVFLGVGVEVANQEDLVGALGFLQFIGERQQGLGLGGAGEV